jgi:hypothetical protein
MTCWSALVPFVHQGTVAGPGAERSEREGDLPTSEDSASTFRSNRRTRQLASGRWAIFGQPDG